MESVARFLLTAVLLLSLCFGAQAADVDSLLEEGATAVSDGFMREDESITEAVIPHGVDRIESGAFYGCTNLRSVSLPQTLQKIGSYAFYQCAALEQVEIPASVALIEGNAFYGCDSLSKVVFHGKAPLFAGSGAFWFAAEGLTFYVPAGESEVYAAVLPEGAAIVESAQAAAAYDYAPPASELDIDAATGTLTACYAESVRVDVPAAVDGVAIRAIGEGAFAHNQMIHIVNLPEGVEAIGNSAFSWSGVQFIGLPESLKAIGAAAFDATPLRVIDLPQGFTAIGERAFSWCQSLTDIRIPEGVEAILPNTFEKCTYLETAMLPASLAAIGEGAFLNCDSLRYVITAGYALPEIDPDAFAGTALSDIDLPWDATRAQADAALAHLASAGLENVSVWRGDPPGAAPPDDYWYGDGLLLASGSLQEALLTHWNYYDDHGNVVPVVGLGEGVFRGNTTLKRFHVPSSEQFTTIGAYAFADSALEAVDLFDTVTTIGEGAFQNCGRLAGITLPDSVTSIGPGAFAGSGITGVVIPPNAQAEPEAFAGIPPSGIRISDAADDGQVAAWSEALGFPWYAPVLRVSEERIPLAAMPDTLVPNPEGDFTFDATSGTIEEYMGAAADIVIPRTIGGVEVKRIGVTAFSNLSLLTILDDTDQDAGIRSVVIPETVEHIDDSAFAGCVGLEKVDCYGPLTRLGRSAFDGCTALERAVFHNGVRHIDNYAFNFCTSLARVDWGHALDTIGESAFHQSGLAGALVVDAEHIGEQAFWRCASLTEVHITGRIRSIGRGAFMQCPNLAAICLEFTDAGVFEGLAVFAQTAEDAKTYVPAGATEEQVSALYNKMAAYNGGHLSAETDLILHDCARDAAEPPEPTIVIGEDDVKTDASAAFADVLFVCVQAEAGGAVLDPAILGRYDVTFHGGGTATLTIGGVEMPGCPWQDEGDAIVVDYFGVPFVFERVGSGLQMNYYDTMLLIYEAER
ncbi:MAG: leucine-rich repeat domain-containing protein [Clostridia bacterium]|nr:leucine-rich repeat domain-containing protein [Clostridia bacterium]